MVKLIVELVEEHDMRSQHTRAFRTFWTLFLLDLLHVVFKNVKLNFFPDLTAILTP